ncbi:hypothetical protein SH661x_004025 [Planctomicrobium sp. SH661]|uniref:hypothetical protein n=1 Tax=Planctomicrobium sp. SH661 TaxID=3448124 RepID=UPI003F5C1362
MNLKIKLLSCLSLGFLMLASRVHGAGIEADPEKTYALTKSRGPWLIMVATLHTTGDDGKTEEGKSPQQAAHELVLELRKLGLPAYVYEYDPGQQHIVSKDSLGREEHRKNFRRIRSVCVLAGNYNDINDKLAQDSLEWVKKLKPKSFQDGVYFEPTPGRPGPLSGAFLTMNPLLSGKEIEQKQIVDPLLVQLNTGEQHSLFENKGEYTLVIARFYGRHVNVKAAEEETVASQFFNSAVLKKGTLDEAAKSARELGVVLRSNYDREPTNFNNIDAYVWHDRHESVVTVGSFSSPDDPAVKTYIKRFGPKVKDLGTGATNFQPEHIGVSGFGPKGDEKRLWLLEPNPELMRVPKYR